MTGANGNAIPVQDLGNVMRVDAFESTRGYAAFFLGGRAENLHTRDLFEAFEGIGNHFAFVGSHRLPCRSLVRYWTAAPKPMASAMAGVPAFELMRYIIGCEGVQVDGFDHVAAAQEGWHGAQQFRPAIQGADAGGDRALEPRRPGNPFPGLHIHRQVRHGLGSIHQVKAPAACARRTIFCDGINRPRARWTCR